MAAAAARQPKAIHGKICAGTAFGLCQESLNIIIVLEGKQQQRPRQQSDPTKLGHDQGLHTPCHGLGIIIIEGDQGIRAQRGDFPKNEDQQQVGGQNQPDHRTDEEQYKGVVPADLTLTFHVIHGENHRQAANHRGHGSQEYTQAHPARR